MKRTTFFYILREVLQIFLIGLMTLTIILLMDKIFKLIELIVAKGVDPLQILKLLMFIAPSFFIFTIPMSLLVGTLLGFGRLSSDNEITAFKASGVSLYQLFLPVFLLSIVACLITAFLVFYALPWGNRGFKSTLFLIAQSKADVEIQERVFNDDFEDLVVYVEKVPIEGKKLEGILIYDEREKGTYNTVFAREGFLISDPESQAVTLRLLHGNVHRMQPKTDTYQMIEFDSYDLRLELAQTFAAIGKKLKDYEMSIGEIEDKIDTMKKEGKNTTSQEVELHKRYAIPFVCIVFALIGVPLGIQPRRSGKSNGFIFSILILLGYYISLIGAEVLAVRRLIPVALAGWMPNLLFGSLGVYLLIKAARDLPSKPSVWLNETLDTLQQKWRNFLEHA